MAMTVVPSDNGVYTTMQTPNRQQRPIGTGRNILKEKNVPALSLVPNESIISHGNTSLASTVSYTDFQVQINFKYSSTFIFIHIILRMA